MSNPAGSKDLHGNAPDNAPVVLLIIDAINDLAFEEGREVLGKAIRMAHKIRLLKARARRVGIPAIYLNDNFGRWRSDFRTVVAHCGRSTSRGREVTRLLRPDSLDYFVLKPKHSGFFSTTLELLLEHLQARTLILCGLLTDVCVLFTAQDAYMRGYRILVPADCVVARTAAEGTRALALMHRVLDADTRPSTDLQLSAPAHSPGHADRINRAVKGRRAIRRAVA